MKLATVLLLALAAAPVVARSEAWHYLGETPPEDTPKRFPLPTSPGFFAAERIAISHDRRTIYFTELNGYNADSINQLQVISCNDGQWSKPALVYSGPRGMPPALAVDENRLLLNDRVAERRPNGTLDERADFRPGQHCHYLQQTKSGRYYFAVVNQAGTEFDIVRTAPPGRDAPDEKMGFNLVMKPPFPVTLDFFMARDESYVILFLCGARDYPCAGASDLFIAFRQPKGGWSTPRSLGAAINTPVPAEWRWGPYVTDDGKYLFFTRESFVGEEKKADIRVEWVRFDRLRERLERESR